jgi:sterol desaturase/sphingolipid hydroxylase (fatty acid hydroxylase superfamily)
MPDPTGLYYGLISIIMGQIVVIAYHYWHIHYSGCKKVQMSVIDTRKTFWGDCMVHVIQPEGFILLGGYLTGTWMLNLMPASYYTWKGGVNILKVLMQLCITDFLQATLHVAEHKMSTRIYQQFHKHHHRFTNPKMFDAFNGSVSDTLVMIIVPLCITANLIHCNVWTYIVFGTIYSMMLTLIHSEMTHPWDAAFSMIGFGTAGDHHVHHRCFIYNYGHLFMWWDKMAGTYKSPLVINSFCKDISYRTR